AGSSVRCRCGTAADGSRRTRPPASASGRRPRCSPLLAAPRPGRSGHGSAYRRSLSAGGGDAVAVAPLTAEGDCPLLVVLAAPEAELAVVAGVVAALGDDRAFGADGTRLGLAHEPGRLALTSGRKEQV